MVTLTTTTLQILPEMYVKNMDGSIVDGKLDELFGENENFDATSPELSLDWEFLDVEG